VKGRPSSSASCRISTNEVELPLGAAAQRAATEAPRASARKPEHPGGPAGGPRVPQAGRRQGKNPVTRSSLLKKADLRALSKSSRVRDFAEGAQLDWNEKPLQGAREPSPVRAPGSHFLFCRSTCR